MAVPTVTVAVAIPPQAVSSPRIDWTTKAPTVTAAASAAPPTIRPSARTCSTRRWTAARSTSVPDLQGAGAGVIDPHRTAWVGGRQAGCGTRRRSTRTRRRRGDDDVAHDEVARDVLAHDEVLDHITTLVDHSLLAREAGPASTSRYRLLETLRIFRWPD